MLGLCGLQIQGSLKSSSLASVTVLCPLARESEGPFLVARFLGTGRCRTWWRDDLEKDVNLGRVEQDLESGVRQVTVVGHTCTIGVTAPCCYVPLGKIGNRSNLDYFFRFQNSYAPPP